MSRSALRCLPPSRRSPSLTSSTPTTPRPAREHSNRRFHDSLRGGRRLFLCRRNGWTAALSRFPVKTACVDKGRQSRPWLGRTRSAAARAERAWRIEDRRHLGSGYAFRCFHSAIDRTRASSRPEMSIQTFLDIALALLVIGVAVWTIVARDLFAAVVAYVAYGLFLALVWIRMYAPDVALTEAAVGGGVTGVLLVAAGKRLDISAIDIDRQKPSMALATLAAGCSILVARALPVVILSFPDPAPPLRP